eukprot:COSAG01_NODE_1427_length_10336_cov_12.761207_9_plen_64_part_00
MQAGSRHTSIHPWPWPAAAEGSITFQLIVNPAFSSRNYTMEGAAAVHFIVNMGARNGFFIVGM